MRLSRALSCGLSHALSSNGITSQANQQKPLDIQRDRQISWRPGRLGPCLAHRITLVPDFSSLRPGFPNSREAKRAGLAGGGPIQVVAGASLIDGRRRDRSRLLSASAGFSTKCHDSIASGMVRPQASMKLGNTAIGPKRHTSVCCTA